MHILYIACHSLYIISYSIFYSISYCPYWPYYLIVLCFFIQAAVFFNATEECCAHMEKLVSAARTGKKPITNVGFSA